MIKAIDEAQLAQQRRNRSAAAGPAFSVPALPGIADTLLFAAPAFGGPICTGTTAAPTPSLDLTSFLGRSVGSGQCVALVQAASPALGNTAGWTAGAAVQGNTALRPGTPIATFGADNRYANATDGSSHAAIYLGQDAQGLQVLDQWAGSGAAVRTIPWSRPGAAAANTGAAFRVIQTG